MCAAVETVSPEIGGRGRETGLPQEKRHRQQQEHPKIQYIYSASRQNGFIKLRAHRKKDNGTPFRWPLARIVEIFSGADGEVTRFLLGHDVYY